MRKSVLCLFGSALLACGAFAQASQPAQGKIVPNDADVAFVVSMAESAARQYNAMTPAEKRKVEAQVARLVPKGVDPKLTIQALKAYCARAKKGMTAADKAQIHLALTEYPSWCAAVKATRLSRQGMQRLGMPCKELSLQDMLNLVPN